MVPRKGTLYAVYAIQCDANGKVYIGSSADPVGRIKSHFSELKRRMKRHACDTYDSAKNSDDWQKDYEKYGAKAFTAYVIEKGIDSEHILEREEHFTEMYHSDEPGKGYNVWRGNRFKNYSLKIVDGMPKLPEEH